MNVGNNKEQRVNESVLNSNRIDADLRYIDSEFKKSMYGLPESNGNQYMNGTFSPSQSTAFTPQINNMSN